MLALSVRSQLGERPVHWWLVRFHIEDRTQFHPDVNLRHCDSVCYIPATRKGGAETSMTDDGDGWIQRFPYLLRNFLVGGRGAYS